MINLFSIDSVAGFARKNKDKLDIIKHGNVDSGAIYETGNDFCKTIVRKKREDDKLTLIFELDN
ncbi:MAG: hypothetical protein IJU04_01160 [Ruminococcus sp.]|nr:hypothetical protein [Ruminococcus sp.]